MEDLVKSFFLFIAILGAIALAQFATFLLMPALIVIGLIFWFSNKK